MCSNNVVLASAGSRKTTLIVEEALKDLSRKVLIVTYTNDNTDLICNYITKKYGFIPESITVMTWFSFLLQHGVRPYQNYLYEGPRSETIFFPDDLSTFKMSRRFINREDIGRLYFTRGGLVIGECMSDFVCRCDELSRGKVIKRLEAIFDSIYIDEIQDLAGYDFDLVKRLFESNISTTVVGDCRQATYFTNCSPKNRRFKGQNIVNLFDAWEREKLCSIVERNECYRSNQSICDFGDSLYPELSKTISKNDKETGHDGVFTVHPDAVKDYMRRYNPTVLRDNKNVNTFGYAGYNFGLTKGKSFNRVLLFPNGPMREFLVKKNPADLKDKTKANFYVGITRARFSVGIVTAEKSAFENIQEYTVL